MKQLTIIAVLSVLACALLPAQQQKPEIVAEDGGLQERGSARVLYWGPRVDAALGQFAIDYGRPAWKKDYDDPTKFDAMTRGKIWRLGSNFWTVLDTSIPLRIAGSAIAVGSYYLGLERSADGSVWHLVFIDPVKARAMKLDAYQIQRAPVLFRVPLTAEPAGETAERLTITLSYAKERIKDVKLTIAWGRLRVTAPVTATVGG